MIISCGSRASAIAIITRWRMPPESSWGKASMRLRSTPTSSSSSSPRRRRSARSIWGRCVVSTSASWARTFSTGFSEFMAPWNTIATFDQRKVRSAAPSSARTSTSEPSVRSWKVTAPLVMRAGDRCSWFRP